MNTQDLKTLRQQLTKLEAIPHTLILAIDTVLMNPGEPAIVNAWLRKELEAFHVAHC